MTIFHKENYILEYYERESLSEMLQHRYRVLEIICRTL